MPYQEPHQTIQEEPMTMGTEELEEKVNTVLGQITPEYMENVQKITEDIPTQMNNQSLAIDLNNVKPSTFSQQDRFKNRGDLTSPNRLAPGLSEELRLNNERTFKVSTPRLSLTQVNLLNLFLKNKDSVHTKRNLIGDMTDYEIQQYHSLNELAKDKQKPFKNNQIRNNKNQRHSVNVQDFKLPL